MTDIETRRAALVEKVALAIFDVTPYREHCGPFAEQSDRYKAFTRVLASATIAVALEEAARVCDPKGYCSEMDKYGEHYAAAIRALILAKGTE